jgi:RNA polymerase sigma-70 factor (ECF subfamily)
LDELSDLIRRCQEGDQCAWTQLFQAHHDRVFKTAFLVTGDRQDAHDVTQETFLRLMRVIDRYDESRAAFETWLYTIVVNLSRDHLRRRKRLPLPWDLLDRDELLAGREAQPERVSLDNEWQRDIWKAVGRLGEKHRTAVVLHYYLGFDCHEIARMLSCAEGTVHSRLHYARKALERALGEYEGRLAWATPAGVGK